MCSLKFWVENELTGRAVPDKFIETQLILISPNKLAMHWVGFGHISFLERVNIDHFLVP